MKQFYIELNKIITPRWTNRHSVPKEKIEEAVIFLSHIPADQRTSFLNIADPKWNDRFERMVDCISQSFKTRNTLFYYRFNS
jgi:hypothetical protein